MAGINPATGLFDPNYVPQGSTGGENPASTGNPYAAPPPDSTPVSPTFVSTQTVQEGNYKVTYNTYSDGSRKEVSRALSASATSPSAGGQTQGTQGSTQGSTTPDPSAPPQGADPDQQQVTYDASGNPVIVYKYTANGHTAGQAIPNQPNYGGELAGIGTPPTPNTAGITDLTQTQAYGNLEAAIKALQDPNTTAQDYQNAFAIVAQQMGIGNTAADYTNFIQGLSIAVGTGTETPAQQQQTSQYLYAQRTDAEAEMRKQVDAITSGAVNNSTNQAILTSNQMIRSINNDQIMAQVQLANMHLQANLGAFKEITGQPAQVVQSFQQNRLAAIQSYATEIDAVYKQNLTVFQENTQALDAWKANADNIYNMVNAQLGINNNAMQQVKNNFDQWYVTQQAALQAQLDKAKATGSWVDLILGGLMMIGGVLAAATGIGAAVGGALVAGGAGLAGTGISGLASTPGAGT